MTAAPAPRPPPLPPPTPRAGRLLIGALIATLGVGWLLDTLDVTEFPWEVVLPSALILIGVALLLTSRSAGGHAGLMTAGVVLTVVLLVGSALDFPIGGGVGDRAARPTTEGRLREGFELGVGQLTVDLRGLPLDRIGTVVGTVRSRARVGIGKLVVIVPDGLLVRVEARAGLGDVRVFGAEESGFDVERVVEPGPATTPSLELVLSVGIGQVEVRRG